MKKLISILVLAGALSIPSAVFAEASWYGSLRGGVTFGAGEDARFMDGGSRWGIKGSHDLGDGLSATYRFEHKFSTENASLGGGGRLANIGLSGGFGSLTLGQVWSASYNATGAITDNSLLWGDSATSYRVGNALSYAVSAGSIGMQVDALMDSGTDTGGALDGLEFGLTVDLGDIGRVAFSHVSREDANIMTAVPAMFMPGTPTTVTVTPGTPGTPASITVTPGTAGSPTSVMVQDGTAGTPTSVTVEAGTMAEVASRNIELAPAADAGFNLEIDDDGNLMVVATTRWTVSAANAAGNADAYMTADLVTRTHTTRVDVDADAQGALDADGTATDGFMEAVATPVILQVVTADATTTPTIPTTGQLRSEFTMTEDGWRSNACDELTGTQACRSIAAFAVEYRGGQLTLDDDGFQRAPERLTFVDGAGAEVTHAGTVQEITSVTAGTPTTVTVQDGTAGTPPTVSVTPGEAGTPPTVSVTPGEAGTPPTVEVTPGTPSTFTSASTSPDIDPGYKSSHVAAQFGFGGLTLHLGQSESTANDTNKKTRVTHYGVAGSLGDTGLNYLVQARKVKAGSASSDPWLLSINRSLGDGATAFVEHANADGSVSGKTWIGLKVDF